MVVKWDYIRLCSKYFSNMQGEVDREGTDLIISGREIPSKSNEIRKLQLKSDTWVKMSNSLFVFS